MAYGAVDLGLSVYGVAGQVLKPDAWRLFRYVRADYVRRYEKATKSALTFEATSNAITINSIYKEKKISDE